MDFEYKWNCVLYVCLSQSKQTYVYVSKEYASIYCQDYHPVEWCHEDSFSFNQIYYRKWYLN